jgi:hypothetical protein
MSFIDYGGGGATKLSQLTIDGSKDWAGFAITDLAEIAANMNTGDMIYCNAGAIVKISPGPIGAIFIAQGAGVLPIWSHP